MWTMVVIETCICCSICKAAIELNPYNQLMKLLAVDKNLIMGKQGLIYIPSNDNIKYYYM